MNKQKYFSQGRKIEVVKYYESVLAAKDVHVDAIPLPNMSMSGKNSSLENWYKSREPAGIFCISRSPMFFFTKK
jgi:hypothetical protein